MKAMVLTAPRSTSDGPFLAEVDRPTPRCGPDEVLIRVSACGVCRTDLDLAQGRITAPSYPVVPGHQIVGVITSVGARVSDHRHVGDRVGVAWIHSTCGHCRWCRTGRENLCPHFEATGCDADGGYAEYVAAPAAYTFAIPRNLEDTHVAPLLCAGAVGWRSLRLANLTDGDPLGLTGFGASAHLVLQLARLRFPRSPIYVFARNADERAFARTLGAAWAGDTTDTPPSPLCAMIDTTPAWTPVVEALSRLMPGGRLVINAIRKTDTDRDALARLDYASGLWMEREIKSVANVTRLDVKELLSFVASSPLRPVVEVLPLADANIALERLAGGVAVHGATVLKVERAVAPKGKPDTDAIHSPTAARQMGAHPVTE